MFELPKRILTSQRGSVATTVASIVFTLLVIGIALVLVKRNDRLPPSMPQASSQVETRAFYIAQTALDRSVKALAANPEWRDGYRQVAYEHGTYDVKVFGNEGAPEGEEIPANYVRIVATSEVDGVRKEVEGVWVDAMAAFHNTYSAGNRLELQSHDAASVVVIGDVHNNAWEGGVIDIGAGTRLYGDAISLGPVRLDAGDASNATVFGSVWGSQIELATGADIQRYENLSEYTEGIDLNGDGDAFDMGLTGEPLVVSATTNVVAGGRALKDGDADMQIASGSVAVRVGRQGVGAVPDPRPDFRVYYELAAGASSYPPAADHVTSAIDGDGDGHYFASASAFTEWLRSEDRSSVFCWRCAGEGAIDPDNTIECPTCRATGRDEAIVVAGLFYIDDAALDLSALGSNLVVHGTIVVADGDPSAWPAKSIRAPGGTETIEHFPSSGRFVIKGPSRMHFTQTYRSSMERGTYLPRRRTLFSDQNLQTIAVQEPDRMLRQFPSIVAATQVVIEPRGVGFASHPGDIGDEKLTVLQGVVYGETEVRLHGRGGWSGDTLTFAERTPRDEDDSLDEPVFNVDLNGDGDAFDTVAIADITAVPLVPVSDRSYAVDLNNDGLLGEVTLGMDYVRFFTDAGYVCPILIYHEGIVLGQSIHSCEETLVVPDPRIAEAAPPFGFEVSFGFAPHRGLVSWRERSSR
jgi:hypothetical protein